MTTMYGSRNRLFDAYLDKRETVADQLRENGYDIDRLPSMLDAHGAERAVDELRECGFGGEDATDDLLMEAASTSDFGSYLADKISKRLMHGYTEVSSNWAQYSVTWNASDYKPITPTRLSEMEQLLVVPEGGPYQDSKLSEINGQPLALEDFGRLFSITRRAIINDDLGQLSDRPAALGRAYQRTLGRAVAARLEGNSNAYDGAATFSAGHNNLLTAPLTEQSLATAITTLRKQTDPNGLRIGIRPKTLIVPPDLELVAQRILNSTLVPLAGSTTPSPSPALAHNLGGQNVLQGVANLVVEDYLLDPASWYLFADSDQYPVLGVGFLNGKQTPDVFLRDPGMRNVIGGSDPYSMEFDEIAWKVRGTWGTQLVDWRGAVASKVAS